MATTDRSRATLLTLREEIGTLAATNPTTSSAAFTSWKSRTHSALVRALGAQHHITQSFNDTSWHPSMYVMGDQRPWRAAFTGAAERSQGYLDAAVDELESQSDQVSTLGGAAGVDAELWDFIAGDVEGQHWGKTVSQAVLFTEDRIRRWTGQSADLVGEKLMTAAFGDRGKYRLGLVDGEKQGWHRLSMGVAMALRNAAAHRVEDRPDHRLYALGVVGTCSLLLTQLRYEHSNRFHDRSPVPEELAHLSGSPEK